MSLARTIFAAAVAATFATASVAADLMILDPYARSSSATAVSGAAFMVIHNPGTEDDRLIAVRSDIAERIELHTHIEDANGVMRMIEVEDGIAVPAEGTAMLERGGDHVMLLGLTRPLEQDDTIDMTLVFESGAELSVTVPVDLNRKPAHGGHKMNHGTGG